MKQLVVGILAHVDAGKTTLSEALLYAGGAIRQLGRVDHGDAHLDTHPLERQRGITIFSKQANFQLGETRVQLVDTPGHLDFGSEAERTLQVLDYAILVISGTDGVQAHTRTLWKLLERQEVPVFLFVNKMDLPGADRQALLKELQEKLSPACLDFGDGAQLGEQLALLGEDLMEQYLSDLPFTRDQITTLAAERKVFPCYFGSALRMEGVDRLVQGLEEYTHTPAYPEAFGAMVYKISRDPSGNRLTHMKITGGSLEPKTLLQSSRPQPWAEKVDQIRVCDGAKYTPVNQAEKGMVVAVTGLTHTCPGLGLGIQPDAPAPVLTPVLGYEMRLPEGEDPARWYPQLKELEEEDPTLALVWQSRTRQLEVRVMGQVQLEVLTQRVKQRWGLDVTFGSGTILYRETIAAPVEGIGHFEPLRHYAEVHLLLEPGERGSGLKFAAQVSTDQLAPNWQNLVLTHLEEKKHLGVLTGSPITDMKITLVAGRAHLKHTEGGDFRQATYRAVRQGLMQAQSILLEPVYQYTLQVPTQNLGRAMTDLQQMGAAFDPPLDQGENSVLTGICPVATMGEYSRTLAAYTKGLGRLSCTVAGYAPCHNTQEVVEGIGYNPTADLENTPDSVFCSHGAGYTVAWDQVPAHAHLGTLRLGLPQEEETAPRTRSTGPATDRELEAIFENANYRRSSRPDLPSRQAGNARQELPDNIPWQPLDGEYLLVDGYNIIFAWEDLNALARTNLAGARDALIHLMANYQGYKKIGVILVFDAYRVPGGTGAVEKHGGLYVIYTKEAETADSYIERTTYQIGKKYRVRVATSDGAEQAIILGAGALRMSAGMLRQEMNATRDEISRIIEEHNQRRG